MISGPAERFVQAGSSLIIDCVVHHMLEAPSTVTWYLNRSLIDFDSQRGGVSVRVRNHIPYMLSVYQNESCLVMHIFQIMGVSRPLTFDLSGATRYWDWFLENLGFSFIMKVLFLIFTHAFIHQLFTLEIRYSLPSSVLWSFMMFCCLLEVGKMLYLWNFG